MADQRWKSGRIVRKVIHAFDPHIEFVQTSSVTSNFLFCFFFLESNLTCNRTSTCDVDHVMITCVIAFYGHWAPAIEWRRCDGNDEPIIMTEVDNSISPSERVTSTFIMAKNISYYDFCLKVTACFKEEGRPMGTDADNIPSYNYTTYVTQHCKYCL